MRIFAAARPLTSTALIAAIAVASPALAMVPINGAADTEFGARPGNVIGTGSSLPLSSEASNITADNVTGRIAPRLPEPDVTRDTPRDLLAAAADALRRGQTGLAQEALERAETRLLTRSVPLNRVGEPSTDATAARIKEARLALAAGELDRALSLIDPSGAIAAGDGTA